MKIYDISMEIRKDMPVYKNKEEKKPKIAATRTIEQGANESRISIESHTGTHADAYFHMIANGRTIDKIELEKFVGECLVIDFSNKRDKITIDDFNELFNNKKTKNDKNAQQIFIKKNDILLLKTRKTPMESFDFNFTYLDKSGAEFLAKRKVKCVGIDNLGIERGQPGHETHKILFKGGIPIVEGLELPKIKQGRYFFVGMPLKIKNGDGSPIRAILVDNKIIKPYFNK